MHIENMEDDKGKYSVVTEGKSSSHERLVEVRVLVLEHDDRYLSTLETMLKSFGYSVSKCPRATEALLLLEEDKSGYDMVISDAHLADMDGFKFLQKVGLEMNLSVVLILLEKKRGSILKGSVHGACGYVIKHITSDSLGHIREQMLLKDKDDLRVLLVGDAEFRETNLSSDDHGQETLPAIDEEDVKNSPTLKRIKDEQDHEVHEALYDGIKAKKPRLIWTEELCRVFEIAVEKLGEKAVPKKILDVMENMGVSNLTRENVASHLQKYRMRNKKRTNQNQTKHLLGLPAKTNFEQSNKSEEELKFQFCISPNQLPFRSITLESNSHVAPLPCQRNMNPSNSSQVMASNYYKMARQIVDDGALGYCTPAVANLQPNRTLEYFSNTHDQSCQVNEIAACGQIIGGSEDEYLPFGYEIENFGNTASKETNNAVMSQPLTMSGQYGFPLQDASDPLNCTISGNDYVSLGNNAPPYYNEPSVGNAFYPNFGSG